MVLTDTRALGAVTPFGCVYTNAFDSVELQLRARHHSPHHRAAPWQHGRAHQRHRGVARLRRRAR